MKDNYSLVSKVCLFSSKEKQSRVVITDQHSNAYFAKKILSVEGETELELFDNAYLITLFPHLKQVEIICGMSNYVVQKIISPSLRRYQTPIVSVIDMDKVITKLPGKNCFVPVKNSPIKPDDKKNENYLYSYKRRDTLHIRNRILKMLNWCRFHYILPFFSCTDDNFKELIELIQKYLLQYNLFAVSTTIEGALITPNNYEGFWEYLKERFSQNKDWQRFEDLYNSLEEQERVNAMRLLCNGKSDYIMSLKEVKRDNPKLSSTTGEAISKNKIEKTSGWVSEWLEFYICKKLGLTPFTENAYNEFKRAMLVTRNKEMLEKYFRTDFEELYRLIEMIKNA